MTNTQITIIFKKNKPLKFIADEFIKEDEWILIFEKGKAVGAVREAEVRMVFLTTPKKDEIDEEFFSDNTNFLN